MNEQWWLFFPDNWANHVLNVFCFMEYFGHEGREVFVMNILNIKMQKRENFLDLSLKSFYSKMLLYFDKRC